MIDKEDDVNNNKELILLSNSLNIDTNNLSKIEVLNINWKESIRFIPNELTQLRRLFCHDSSIQFISNELTNLEVLYCHYTSITSIPKELTRLNKLNCTHTEITYIPDN